MNFKDDMQLIFDIHRKAIKVVVSCTNRLHLESAERYFNNLKALFKTISCRNKMEVDALENIVKSVESLVKIKRRSLK
jgi:hypothetical protein